MDDSFEWVEEFRRRHGRAPRILHVGNIANNAYLAAKILNARGFDCDVICHDYYHIMGSPEWEEAEFRVDGIDHNNPDWHAHGSHGFVRPRWFVQGPQLLCLDYLMAKRQGDERRARKLWRELSVFNRTHGNPGNETAIDRFEEGIERVQAAGARMVQPLHSAIASVRKGWREGEAGVRDFCDSIYQQHAAPVAFNIGSAARARWMAVSSAAAAVRQGVSAWIHGVRQSVLNQLDRAHYARINTAARLRIARANAAAHARILRANASARLALALRNAVGRIPGVRRARRMGLTWDEALLAMRNIASRPDAMDKVRSRLQRIEGRAGSLPWYFVRYAMLPTSMAAAYTVRKVLGPVKVVQRPPRRAPEAIPVDAQPVRTDVAPPVVPQPGPLEGAAEPVVVYVDVPELPLPEPEAAVAQPRAVVPPRDPVLERIAATIAVFGEVFPQRKDQLTFADCNTYRGVLEKWAALFEQYDVVQAYATCVAFPLLAGIRHYVGFEHGTLRVFTLDDNANSRLTALGFNQARHTLITNGDCLEYAQKIGVTRYTPMPHPLDERRYEEVHGDYEGMHRKYGVKYLFFCPVRHDWEVKGTDQYIRALPQLVQHLGRDFRIIMTKWGAQVQDSIRLAEDLGVLDLIAFIDPLNRADMTRLSKSVDAVLDQIGLPVFGGISPTAIAQGVPVIMSYEPSASEWLFPEPAPILSARTASEIAVALRTAVDPQWLKEFRVRAADWYGRFHSSDVVARKLSDVYRQVIEDCGAAGERGTPDPLPRPRATATNDDGAAPDSRRSADPHYCQAN